MRSPVSNTVLTQTRNFVKTVRSSRLRPTQCQGPSVHKPTARPSSTFAESRLPRIAQASIWEQIIPRAIRERSRKPVSTVQKQPRNPASYFIWIYLFIGSQAIRILGLQNEHKTYIRRADLKIEHLREVVRKLQAGEAVDVEKELGTGDEQQELEWEEALREIETEEKIWQDNKKSKTKETEQLAQEREDASPVNRDASETQSMIGSNTSPQPPYTTPGFY